MPFHPLQRLAATLGVPDNLSAPIPTYRVITDGLVIADRRAQAWFVIEPSPSQMLSDDERIAEVTAVMEVAQRALRDRTCQLVVCWGRLTGDGYDPGHEATLWSQQRAASISAWDLAERHVLLGVDLEDRTTTPVLAALKRSSDWLRDDDRTIPRRELDALRRDVDQLASLLADSPWKATPAPVETLAWLISRHYQRESLTTVPPRDMLTGPTVARLVRGNVKPWPDHIRYYDVAGHESGYSAFLGLTDFPEQLTVPGNGEWLLALSGIARAGVDGEPDTVPVHAEAHVRFDLLSPRTALKTVNRVRKSAKEQRREASRGGHETSLDIAMSEEEMSRLEAEINRGRTSLIRAMALVSVTESTREALQASVDAVRAQYGDLAITADVLTDEQREAWLQATPCDELRLSDLAHVMDNRAFFNSWFWGGSIVGDRSPGPAIGYTTGATPTVVRARPTDAPRRGDTATVAIVGRSGRGKTTSMQLMALDAADEQAWVMVYDLKGDLGGSPTTGIVAAAKAFGTPAESADVSDKFAGTADLLALSSPEQALSAAHGQLMLLISDALRLRAQPVLMEAIASLLETPDEERSTARLIDRLAASDDDTAQRIAAELRTWQSDVFGAAIVGKTDGKRPLGVGPGIHLIRFPGLVPPPAGVPISEWTTTQRVQAAVIRGFLAWTMQVAATSDLRGLRKMVCLPEAHLLTATTEGAAFLDQVARMGRALGVTLLIDTQDTASIANNTGIMEQINTVLAFSQYTVEQQDALAKLLGLQPTDTVRAQIRDISTDPLTGDVWHGHCLMRDYRGRVASVQIAYPSQHVADLLNTNPRDREEEDSHAA